MARARGVNVMNETVRGHQHEDGYVQVSQADGYTVVNSLVVDSVFESIVRGPTAGLWTATLKEAYPTNLLYFNCVPTLYTSSSPAIVFFTLLSNNVGVAGTTNWNQGTPQVINFAFTGSTGTPADLPHGAGFVYTIGLSYSTAYYVESY